MKIVSGGQTGVERGALRAAKAAGFETGGWMRRGWLAEDGLHPEFADLYGLQEHEASDLASRTWRNIEIADATLILADNIHPIAMRITVEFCERMNKPHAAFNPASVTVQDVLQWLSDVAVLNVAGNRELKSPGIEQWSERFLCGLFAQLRAKE